MLPPHPDARTAGSETSITVVTGASRHASRPPVPPRPPPRHPDQRQAGKPLVEQHIGLERGQRRHKVQVVDTRETELRRIISISSVTAPKEMPRIVQA
jgi:hypothetical protein